MIVGEAMDTRVDPADFFREFYPRLYTYVWTATGGPHEVVEDLVQDVLLHAWRDRERFRGEASPFTWLVSIARNRVREGRRGGQRRGRAYDALRALRQIESEELPPDVLRAGETQALLWAALERVGAEAAALLRDKYLHGRSVREIAEAAGESEKTIESRLFRAKEALRNALQEGFDDEGP